MTELAARAVRQQQGRLVLRMVRFSADRGYERRYENLKSDALIDAS